jgi:hypothetical protein
MAVQVIGYHGKAGGPAPKAAYYLATTHDRPQFYLFLEPKEDGSTKWELIDHLDRGRMIGAADKETAKIFAKRLGLHTYLYVKVG